MSDEDIRNHVSKHSKDHNALLDNKCVDCHGQGYCDDSAPGDISFRTWICDSCKGTGYKHFDGDKLSVEVANRIGEAVRTALRDITGKEHPFALTLIDRDQDFSKIKDIKYQHVASASRPLVVMVYMSILEKFRGGGKPRNGFRS